MPTSRSGCGAAGAIRRDRQAAGCSAKAKTSPVAPTPPVSIGRIRAEGESCRRAASPAGTSARTGAVAGQHVEGDGGALLDRQRQVGQAVAVVVAGQQVQGRGLPAQQGDAQGGRASSATPFETRACSTMVVSVPDPAWRKPGRCRPGRRRSDPRPAACRSPAAPALREAATRPVRPGRSRPADRYSTKR